MIRAKLLRDQSMIIMEDGKLYKFNTAGTFVGEVQRLPQYLEGMQSYPIVSLLSSGGRLQLGVFNEDDTFAEYDLGCMELREAIIKMTSTSLFFKILKRTDECDGVRFTQGIFVCQRGTDLRNTVRVLGGKL